MSPGAPSSISATQPTLNNTVVLRDNTGLTAVVNVSKWAMLHVWMCNTTGVTYPLEVSGYINIHLTYGGRTHARTRTRARTQTRFIISVLVQYAAKSAICHRSPGVSGKPRDILSKHDLCMRLWLIVCARGAGCNSRLQHFQSFSAHQRRWKQSTLKQVKVFLRSFNCNLWECENNAYLYHSYLLSGTLVSDLKIQEN